MVLHLITTWGCERNKRATTLLMHQLQTKYQHPTSTSNVCSPLIYFLFAWPTIIFCSRHDIFWDTSSMIELDISLSPWILHFLSSSQQQCKELRFEVRFAVVLLCYMASVEQQSRVWSGWVLIPTRSASPCLPLHIVASGLNSLFTYCYNVHSILVYGHIVVDTNINNICLVK